MAVWNRSNKPTLTQRSRAMVASAAKVQIDDIEGVKKLLRRRQNWQDQAAVFYDEVGVCKHAVNFRANGIGRIRLFVGQRPSPTEDPEEVANPAGEEALAQLASGTGGHFDVLFNLSANLTVMGECYLVGLAARPEINMESAWEIASVQELIVKDEKATLKDGKPSGGDLPLTDADDPIRIWQRHPLKGRGYADSTLRGVLSTLEEILLLEKALRAVLRSRAGGNGVLVLPEEFSFGSPDPTSDSGDGAGRDDPFLEELIQHMSAPLANEASGSAVVPLIIQAKAEYLDKIQHIKLDRPLEQFYTDRTTAAIKRFAQGVDLPVEISLGMSDVVHAATAWQVEESTFKDYFLPHAIMIYEALTTGYLRPWLQELGQDASELVVWGDPSDLIVRPNRIQDAKDAHEQLAISDASLREVLHFDDTDAPDDEELARRSILRRGTTDPGIVGVLLALLDPRLQQAIAEANAQTNAPASVTASAHKNLGTRLAEMDRVLKTRLLTASDAAMRRALERAGAKVVTAAKKDKSLAASVKSSEQARMCATLGPTIVAGLGLSDASLIEGAFSTVAAQFRTWAGDVAKRALKAVPGISPERVTAEHAKLTSSIDEASRALHDDLTALAQKRLYDPTPGPEQVGEFDESSLVPYGIIRNAVGRAGGQTNPMGGIVLGLATGALLNEVLKDHGHENKGYVWVYGEYPRVPFPPHEALDGVEFESFTDEVLANNEGWPDRPYFLPGDHGLSCMCDVDPIVEEVAA